MITNGWIDGTIEPILDKPPEEWSDKEALHVLVSLHAIFTTVADALDIHEQSHIITLYAATYAVALPKLPAMTVREGWPLAADFIRKCIPIMANAYDKLGSRS